MFVVGEIQDLIQDQKRKEKGSKKEKIEAVRDSCRELDSLHM